MLMLLIRLCLRWLPPVAEGIESRQVRILPAPAAVTQAASRHHIGLAPIHAPPSRLRSS
ncbi:conserved hypothetical protein [Burkholderiales bacterium 8X]|nr:conserved hypothetical protein [Burkholderiales bacterium 8X]